MCYSFYANATDCLWNTHHFPIWMAGFLLVFLLSFRVLLLSARSSQFKNSGSAPAASNSHVLSRGERYIQGLCSGVSPQKRT